MNPKRQVTQDFYPEVHLLAGKLVPIVTITQLGGSCANRHHTPNPQRVPHNQHKRRTLNVTSNILESPFASFHGE